MNACDATQYIQCMRVHRRFIWGYPWRNSIWNMEIKGFGSIDIRLSIIMIAEDVIVEVPRAAAAKQSSNYISTSKYSLVTFLPFALLLQFKRYANFYFLVCAILQSIPLISPLSPFSAIAPLVFVLSLSLLREAFQDYKRYQSDEHDNAQLSQTFTRTLKSTAWRDIKTGDIVRIHKEEAIPVDMLLLICSSQSGIAFVETSSLDGEKNLKPKVSLSSLQLRYNATQELPNLRHFKAKAICSQPSALVDAFKGSIDIYTYDIEFHESMNSRNMLLRGCKLKNTDWAIGLAIYTGVDTVIMKNSSEGFPKISSIQTKVNKIILLILVFEVLCCLGSALFCYFQCEANLPLEQELLRSASVDCVSAAGISFGAYFILYNTFIPISLIVSLQFVKVFQGYFMAKDRQMYCGINERAMECHNVSINEELGQVDYILTDKTGTLTCNKMQFRNIAIGNHFYGEDALLPAIPDNFNFARLSQRQSPLHATPPSFDLRALNYDIENLSDNALISLAFTIITTCHECVCGTETYEGPSPDEVALLKAADRIGFRFLSNENKRITIDALGTITTFEILKLEQFDSDRKRMSVVLKISGKTYVFVKGADSTLLPLLAADQPYLQSIVGNTTKMSRIGLRSLWLAFKIIPEGQVPSDTNEFQKDLTLIAASGIEDHLQDYVPETIFALREAGIKIIMLTGDKLETAENIARSCKLIEQGILIRDQAVLEHYVQTLQANQLGNIPETASPIIDGSLLSLSSLNDELAFVLVKCKSAVFCRVTPAQKAEVVRAVRQLGKVVLAIGDGANDVNMIMEANVGVGILGEEGTRAAQVANYAIGEFCLLWKLVLFYGRLNYIRITELILYFFYKNMVFTVVQLVYCFYNIGSGQSFWLSWSITLYNMVFTFFPVVIRAVFEVDIDLRVNKSTLKQLSEGLHSQQLLYSYYPHMYHANRSMFTHVIFLSWLVLGLLQGGVCLLITLYGMDSFILQYGLYFCEVSAYTSVIIVITLKLAINVKQWNIILWIGFLVPSLGAYVIYLLLSNIFDASLTFSAVTDLYSTLPFYLTTMLCVLSMFAVDLLLFSFGATRQNFQNYLKFRTIRRRSLSLDHLEEYAVEMRERLPQ